MTDPATNRPLGHNQLAKLEMLSKGYSQVIPCKVCRSLIRRGLARCLGDDALVHITPDGYRAWAAAIDGGRVEWPPRFKGAPEETPS